MAFSSFSAYLDHPNLHQLQQSGLHQGGPGGGGGGLLENRELPNGPPPPPSAVGGGLGSIRPGSMVDRARQANVPVPMAGLKCPRCESTHTKFCYFNNYSLTQPRHFCKTCRRYWTRGGALRNVPVGGGCRRNKRSKGGNNTGPKSSSSTGVVVAPSLEKMKPVAAMDGGNGGGGSTSPCVSPTEIRGHYPQLTPPQQAHMTTAPAFQNVNHYEGSNGFSLSPLVVTSGGGGGMGELGFQFPYLGGYHELLGGSSHSNLYPNFHMSESSAPSPSSATKMEETRSGLNHSTKHFIGTLENNNNNHYWGWTGGVVGFSGLNASSPTTHDLL